MPTDAEEQIPMFSRSNYFGIGGTRMSLRDVVVEELSLLFEEDGLVRPEFVDELVLLSTELDSLGFAVLVARLDERLGYDPFSLMEEPVYPQTLGEFVEIYGRFSPDDSGLGASVDS